MEKGTVVVYADHTFEFNGQKSPIYRWALSRDKLLFFWPPGMSQFTEIESPGVFVIPKNKDGNKVRIEKIQ